MGTASHQRQIARTKAGRAPPSITRGGKPESHAGGKGTRELAITDGHAFGFV